MSSTWGRLGEHGPSFRPTWTHLAPTWTKLGSNMAQLGPKLDTSTSAQVELHTFSTWGTRQAQYEILEMPCSLLFPTFFWHFSHVLSTSAPTWCEPAAELAPSCTMLDLTWAGPTCLGHTWADLAQLQLGLNLGCSWPCTGSSCVMLGPLAPERPELAQVGAKFHPSYQPDMHINNVCVYLYIYIYIYIYSTISPSKSNIKKPCLVICPL